MPTFATSNQHSTRSPRQSNQTRKENKRHANWKERHKLLLFVDDIIIYAETQKIPPKEKKLIRMNK